MAELRRAELGGHSSGEQSSAAELRSAGSCVACSSCRTPEPATCRSKRRTPELRPAGRLNCKPASWHDAKLQSPGHDFKLPASLAL
eukprot:5535161-Alexandrium_andersonii.AAC.1